MSDEHIQGDSSSSVDPAGQGGELLEALRPDAEFSVGQYGGLDSVLDKLEETLSGFISGFAGVEGEFSLSTVALYSDAQQFSVLGAGPCYSKYVCKTRGFVLCLGLTASSFKQILGSMLGSAMPTADGKGGSTLSGAENKLFQRFSNHFCSTFCRIRGLDYAACQLTSSGNRLPEIASDDDDLIMLTYDVSLAGSKFSVCVLTTLDILDPVYSSVHEQVDGEEPEAPEVKWSRLLNEKVDAVEIPLFAQLAKKSMNLVDVARLKKGMQLDIEFELSNVNIADKEDNGLFHADIRLEEDSVELCVSSTQSKMRG